MKVNDDRKVGKGGEVIDGLKKVDEGNDSKVTTKEVVEVG